MKVPLLAALALLLASCSRQDAPAPQQPAPAKQHLASSVDVTDETRDRTHELSLMQALFGERFAAEHSAALAQLRQDDGSTGIYQMHFVSSVELPDGRTVVVVNARPSDEEWNDHSAHGTEGIINVYFMRREAAGWKVLERRENVGSAGSNGWFGEVIWLDLGPERPGFAVAAGGTWQGYSATYVQIYDLADGIKALGGFTGYSNNSGACIDETERCWEYDGKLRIAEDGSPGPYRDILVDFTGKEYTVDSEGRELTRKDLRQQARYRFDGKAYVLVEGHNPAEDS